MFKNAIILAAGKSGRFAPFTYEKPKGLFIVRGEVLIERQIEQLIEADINEIIIVVGYMKEKFFYLEQKYPQVKLIVNNTFGKYGNIYSLYVARKYLKNTFICCADHYFLENPFTDENTANKSYRACSYFTGSFREFSVDYSDADIITGCYVGGADKMAMVGHAYFNENFSKTFTRYMEEEINNFGIANMFWEEFYTKHIKSLTLHMKKFNTDKILEFDNIDDLRQFDSDFLLNVDSDIIDNITNTLDCHPNQIKDITVIQAGLTNVSFKFTVNHHEYVYRHPGGTADNLINRQTELYVQNMAKEVNLDNSLIYMDKTGWKISHYINNLIPCDLYNNRHQLNQAIEALHKTHQIPITDDVKNFDSVEEGKKLAGIASNTKGNLFKEFKELFDKVDIIDKLVKQEQKEQDIQLVVCHNDIYEPNFLTTRKGDFYLIDWEYAGLNDPVNDICTIFIRNEYTRPTTEEMRTFLLEAYYGRKLTDQEYKHAMGQSILTAFYWFCWGLYKGSVGDDDGFFFLPSYRYLAGNIDEVLKIYEVTE